MQGTVWTTNNTHVEFLTRFVTLLQPDQAAIFKFSASAQRVLCVMNMKTRVWQFVAIVSMSVAGWQTYRLSNTQTESVATTPKSKATSDEREETNTADLAVASQQHLVDDLMQAQTTDSICAALDRVAYVHSREAVDATVARASDARAEVRACAASSLAHHSASAAREMLVSLVRDRADTVAISAMNSLGPNDGDDVDLVLREATRSTNVNLAAVAFSALARLRRPQLASLMTDLLPRLNAVDQSSIVKALANTHDAEVVDTLMQLSEKGLPEQRATMLRALGRTGDPRAYAYLRARAGTAGLYDMLAIVQGLAEDDSLESRTVLLNAVDTGDEEVANAAIVALTTTNDPTIAPVALRWLAAQRLDLLPSLGRYFFEHPDPAAAPMLAKVIDENEYSLDDVETVFPALVSCDVDVATALARKLATEHRDLAVSPLMRELEKHSATASVAFEVARTLVKDGRRLENPWDILQMLARDPSPEGKQLLVALAQNRDASMHVEALDALLQSGDPEVRSVIESIARDPTDPAADTAWTWLTTWGGHEGVLLLLSLQSSFAPPARSQALERLSATGDPAVVAYLPVAARESEPIVRQWAAREASRRWGAENNTLLESLASDSNSEVAMAALRPLTVRSPERAQSLLTPWMEGETGEAAIEIAQRLPTQMGLPLIASSLRAKSDYTVSSAIAALSRFHDAQAHDWIAWVMRDNQRSISVRQQAAQTLLGGQQRDDDVYGREAREVMQLHEGEPVVAPATNPE